MRQPFSPRGSVTRKAVLALGVVLVGCGWLVASGCMNLMAPKQASPISDQARSAGSQRAAVNMEAADSAATDTTQQNTGPYIWDQD